jgi:hypothetical protein
MGHSRLSYQRRRANDEAVRKRAGGVASALRLSALGWLSSLAAFAP